MRRSASMTGRPATRSLLLRIGPISLVLTLIAGLALLGPRAQAATAGAPGPAIAAGAIRSAANRSVCLTNTQGRNPDWRKAVAVRLLNCGGPGITTWGQVWTAEADHTIRIEGLCLTAPATVTVTGSLRLEPCDGTGQQQWLVSGGQVRLRGSGDCLAPPAGSVRADDPATTRPCTFAAAVQHWLTPVPSAPARALSVASQLLTGYNQSGKFAGLFSTPTDPGAKTCSNVYRAGNCWWWSAIALSALTGFADQDPSATLTVSSIESALARTYQVICGAACPARANESWPYGSGVANFANRYFDDTGWWALTWVNAYQLTRDRSYLYLAQELWSYLTADGWDRSCGGALRQHATTSKRGPSTEDAIANVLYLRLSAWLYLIAKTQGSAGASRYLNGIGGAGGANRVGRWLAGSASHGGTATRPPAAMIGGPFRSELAPDAPARPASSPGSHIMVDDHLTASCAPIGQQMWLHTQGSAVGALVDLYQADKLFGDAADARYYLRVADNLTDTVMTDTSRPGQSPPGDQGIYFTPGSSPFEPPTVGPGGILAEPCEPPPGAEGRWPAGCVMRVRTGPGQYGDSAFLPNKGVFIAGAYCVARTLPAAGFSDPSIGRFIAANATSAWSFDQDTETSSPAATNLNEFGFLWGNVRFSTNDSVLNFATESAALELMDANFGTSSAMC
jgi:hypothetical protein